MSMVINTNIQATRTHNVYNKNNDYMNQALTRVATGQKINSAKDGAANWAISEKMRERIRANDQANQNVQNDTALLKTAQGGIDNTIDILKTLKERALNSANDSNINTDRSAIATEVYQLLEQINDNAAKVKFNGRTLLNGDYDNGAADMFPVSSTTTTEETSETITAPTAATISSPKGSNAVYNFSIAGLKDKDGNDVTSSTLLKNIVDDDGNAMFEEGDLIKFTWEEDGEANQKTYEVKSNTTLGSLATSLTSDVENFAYVAGFDGSSTAANITYSSTATDKVTDSGGQDLTTTENGIFIVGKKEVQITNLAVAVTYEDAANDNAVTTRTAAQEALAFTGVQQATAPTTGSHTVFGISGLKDADGTSAITENSKLVGSTDASSNSSGFIANGKITIKVGDNVALNEFAVTANSTYKDLADAFNAANEDVKMVIAAAGDELKDADGNNVTQNTLDGAQNLKASGAGIYFVGKNGEEVDQVNIYAVNAASPAVAQQVFGATAANGYDVGMIQQAGEDAEETTTDTSKSMTFHVGGEADFYLDINIKTMTVESLLGDSSKNFATLFTDKETARDAVATIDTALQNALNEQTKLGALETRLGYTSDNLVTMNENLEAADSTFRDADIAKEMTNYMKYTVLAQASQYMLAQTSQNAFSVLNLLQA